MLCIFARHSEFSQEYAWFGLRIPDVVSLCRGYDRQNCVCGGLDDSLRIRSARRLAERMRHDDPRRLGHHAERLPCELRIPALKSIPAYWLKRALLRTLYY